MSIEAYINPDFTLPDKLNFLLVTLIGVILCILVILGGVRLSTLGMKKKARRRAIYERSHNRVQRFYEMIISATSVMSFSCAYVIINHIYSILQGEVGSAEYERFSTFISIWEGWKDFVLLLLICLSCVLNSILDKLLIPLKKIDRTEKATVRMLGMFYVIFILAYLNNIGDASEYNPVVLYYLGLMVGRFVYFDASFMDFIDALKNMVKNIYLLILGLLLTGLLCYYGFSKGYLLERNYYLVGAFYTHLFMLVVVFILKHSHLLELMIRKPKGYDEHAGESGGPEEAGDEYGEDEYIEYSDDAYGDETYGEYDNYGEYDDDREYEEEGVKYYNLEEYGDEDEY